jgi:hypothetical protein
MIGAALTAATFSAAGCGASSATIIVDDERWPITLLNANNTPTRRTTVTIRLLLSIIILLYLFDCVF